MDLQLIRTINTRKLDPNTIGPLLKTDHVKFDPPKAKSDIESCSQIVTSCPTVVLEITDNPIAADVIPLLGQWPYASTLIVVKAPTRRNCKKK